MSLLVQTCSQAQAGPQARAVVWLLQHEPDRTGRGAGSGITYYSEVHCQCFPVLSRLSVGFELLRKMGWKEGQGVGPRVKRKPRRQKPGKPIGCGHWYGAHLGLFV